MGAALGALRWREAIFGDDVGDAYAAAWREDAEGFCEDARLVGAEVDDAVGDDDVDGLIVEGEVLDGAEVEGGVEDARLGGVGVGELEHLVGHVDAVGVTGGANAAGGEDDVNAAAGAEVEDAFAFSKFRDGHGVAAAKADRLRGHGELDEVGSVIEGGAEDLAFAVGEGGAAVVGDDAERGLCVVVADFFADVAHGASLRYR